ncbi:alpha/beta hydrolase [Dactylosporangium sp. NPDC051484]|uniref:alpha/beta hydrolase n=1 Tax=Dactylosporangium sp. NPDC051484 TaxID=3154942 RepID=UPI00344F98B3
MPLHPQVEAHLARLAAVNLVGLHTVSPQQAREGARRLTAASIGEAEPVAEVTDSVAATRAGDIPIRIYRPVLGAPVADPLPVVVFFHGGGYVLGDLDSHDALARSIANTAGTVVISVDYPLAPERKYPAQIDTGLAATAWVADHAAELGVDADRLAVAGDSAGGNLAAVVALKARDDGAPHIAFQLLIYPDLDFRRKNDSITRLAGRYGNVTREAQFWFMDHYLDTPAQRLDPRVSPLLEPDLAGLPPAYIITAEYDALRDEGEQYGQRLRDAGVTTTVRRYDGMIHEFLRHPFDDAEVAVTELAAALRDALASNR